MCPDRARWFLPLVVVVVGCPASPVPGRGVESGAAGGNEAATTGPAKVAGAAPPVDGRVVDVAVAGPSSCALLADGRVRCWGVDDHGEHGDLTSTLGVGEASTVGLPGPATHLFRVGDGPARGSYCAALRSGTTWCWGAAEGQVRRRVDGEDGPFEVQALTGIRGLDGQAGTACAIGGGGGLRCWGAGQEGQLGDGSAHVRHRPDEVDSLTQVQQVSVGRGHVCAVHGEGIVSCWGRNAEQQVTPGDPRNRRASPTPVRGLPRVVEVAAGEGLSCAREASGQLWCWGRGSAKQVRKMERADVQRLVASDRVCAVRPGRLDCWTDLASVPVEIPLAGLEGPVAVSSTHECFVTKARAWCRGENRRGQLGDRTHADHAEAVPVTGLDGTAPADAAPTPTETRTLPEGCTLGPLELRQPQFWTRGPFALQDAEAVASKDELRLLLFPEPMARPFDVDAALRGEQRRVELRIPGARAGSLDDRYVSGGEGRTFDLELVDVRARRRLSGLDTTGSPVGTLEITRDDEWICGTVDLHARLVTVRGPFAVSRPVGRR